MNEINRSRLRFSFAIASDVFTAFLLVRVVAIALQRSLGILLAVNLTIQVKG